LKLSREIRRAARRPRAVIDFPGVEACRPDLKVEIEAEARSGPALRQARTAVSVERTGADPDTKTGEPSA